MSATEQGAAAPADAQERRSEDAFVRLWTDPTRGFAATSAVNQSYIGQRYVITGLVFMAIGGVLALLMRTQLAVPENSLIGHELYNQLFTMHGTTMMFLFAVPIVEGIAIYLIPLMIGARDLVFPRLSAFGYWCYLFGGLILYSSLFLGMMPDAGWFLYVPLSGPDYSPAPNTDFWLLGVTFVEISALTAAVELAVSILKSRAPGMSINRMPLFAWYILVVAFMIIFGFPALIVGSVLLEIERAFGWAFFNPATGGDPLLWQHYFWIFGHPEVYIIFLPAAGFVSMIVPTFARRPLAGHVWVILAVIGTGFVSMGLWVHHMFATGLPLMSMGFFSSASMTVSVLAGVQVFAWLATLWLGKPVLRTPLLFSAGFIVLFVMGGLTGVMVAVIPFDWQVHDTYFVVAHFHYVLIGGMVFPLFAALYYWLPNVTGRMLSERIGRWNFWTMFVGFNLAFLPMHVTGMAGMPRRVYTYPPGLGWDTLNLVSTIGAYLFAIGVLIFFWNAWWSRRHGAQAGHNPWNAGTLEWATEAPVPPYNFRSIPHIESAYPLWDQENLFEDIKKGRGMLADPSSNLRLMVGSTPTHGEIDHVIVVPKPTYLPLVAAGALALFFCGFLAKMYGLAAAAFGAAVVVFLVWAWRDPVRDQEGPVEERRKHDVTLGSEGPRAQGWWGLVFTLIVDLLFYIALVFGFLLLWSSSDAWPPGDVPRPDWTLAGAGIVLLLISLLGLFGARHALQRCSNTGYWTSLVFVAVAAALYIWLVGATAADLAMSPRRHAFAAMAYALGGFHLAHVAIGVLFVLFALVRGLSAGLASHPDLLFRSTATFWSYVVALGVINAAVLHFVPDWG